MIQQKIKYTLSSLLVLGLSACTSEDLQGTFDRTADGPIEFTVGVEASPSSVRRAFTRDGETASSYYAMKAGTQVRLKVDGVWKKGTNQEEAVSISKKTTCTTVAAESGSVINALSFAEGEMLYWDDYGIGDPSSSDNKKQGLKVLAVAVDGKDKAPEIKNEAEWESLSWNVATDGKDVLSSDIIVSNNLNAYTFANRNVAEAKKMIFKHPLSKITINLTAADGFPKDGSVGATDHKFENDPTVTLTNAATKGTVSIANATATCDGNKAKLIAGTTSTSDANITVIKQAIVYPDTQLGVNDDDVIAIIEADGNVYPIRAKEIHAAMKDVNQSDFKTRAGYNYILNITLKKSEVTLTATVTDWTKVETDAKGDIAFDNDIVDINVTNPGDAFTNGSKYQLYWKKSTEADYSLATTSELTSEGWTFSPIIYWPNGTDSYYFRALSGNTEGLKVKQNEDVLWGTTAAHNSIAAGAAISPRTGEVPLLFEHAMSKIKFDLETAKSDAAVDLEGAKIAISDVDSVGTISLEDGSISQPTPGTVSTVSGTEVIVIPQTINASILTITLKDGTKYKLQLNQCKDASLKAITAWERGKSYTYTIHLEMEKMQFRAVIKAWDEKQGSGDATLDWD